MTEAKSVFDYHIVEGAITAQKLYGSITDAQLAYNSGVTAGTTTASKSLVAGATKNLNTLLMDVQTVAAATAGALAGPISATGGDNVLVTGANDSKIVTLPSAVAGMKFTVINSVANKLLLVYPWTDDTINGGTATSGYVTVPAGSVAVFIATSASAWFCNLVPSGTTSTAAELNILDGVTSTAAELNIVDGVPAAIVISHTAGASNVVNITCTVNDAAGSPVAKPTFIDFWLSDAATGLGITGHAADTLTATAGSVWHVNTAAIAVRAQTTAAGVATFAVTDTHKTAYYACAALGIDARANSIHLLAGGDYGA